MQVAGNNCLEKPYMILKVCTSNLHDYKAVKH